MPTFICIKDRFNDTHAREFRGEVNRVSVLKTALEFANDLAFEGHERMTVGFVTARDAGAARLRAWTAEYDGDLIFDYGVVDCAQKQWVEQ